MAPLQVEGTKTETSFFMLELIYLDTHDKPLSDPSVCIHQSQLHDARNLGSTIFLTPLYRFHVAKV